MSTSPRAAGASVLTAIGFGYCARRLAATHGADFSRIFGTARSPEHLAALPPGVTGLAFDGTAVSPELEQALGESDVLLLSAPPDTDGDPVLRAAGAILAAHPPRQVIYLTTLGVYGDHAGGWVDEETPPRGGSARLGRRLAAEAQWQAFGEAHAIPVAVLRLAGIYGPGRNALRQVADGSARRIEKPGQVFNRIHVDDIVATIRAVMAQGFGGLLNVADDLPTAPGDPLVYAAQLLGRPEPEPIPFDMAAREMSPMALTFWASNKRVSNARLKTALKVDLAYPTYREGLDALFAAGEGR